MIRGQLLKILIWLLNKELFDFADIDFEKYHEVYDEVGSNSDYVEVKKRELGVLRLQAGQVKLSDQERWIRWGRILQVKDELANFENSAMILKRLRYKDKNISTLRKIFDRTNKVLKNITKN